jgi:hypothetical protein
VWAGIFRWALYVLPEPLSLAGQYFFDIDSDKDKAQLEALLGDHRDVLAALTGNDHEDADPAAAAGNAGNHGPEPGAVLPSAAEDDGNMSANAATSGSRRVAAAPRRKDPR